MLRAIVVGHGEFAAGLVSAVRQIIGVDERFVILSNEGFALEDLERRIRDELAGGAVRVIFTDLPGGSAAMAARRALRDHPDVVLVTGVNLAALLEFALTPLDAPTDAAQLAATKGQAAITLAGGR